MSKSIKIKIIKQHRAAIRPAVAELIEEDAKTALHNKKARRRLAECVSNWVVDWREQKQLTQQSQNINTLFTEAG